MKRGFCGLAALGLFFGVLGHARSDFIYWTDGPGRDIRRANLDGSEQETVLSNLRSAVGIVLQLDPIAEPVPVTARRSCRSPRPARSARSTPSPARPTASPAR